MAKADASSAGHGGCARSWRHLLSGQRADGKKVRSAARQQVSSVNILKAIARLFDRGRSVNELARWLDLPKDQLEDWTLGRPPEPRGREYYYHRFTIPKRHGGQREIDAPSDALKALQRRVLHRLLNPLPLHPAATGFARGRSIVTNALPHANKGVVINLDLADFFHSISAERVNRSFRGLGWDKESSRILTNICTHQGQMPQGAPTSPALSNLVCRRLDTRLVTLAARYDGHYTRYADDITISYPQLRSARRSIGKSGVKSVTRRLLAVIRKIIEDEGFKIQRKKHVRIQRAHQRQTATGLVVNTRVNLHRAFRRTVRAAEHRDRVGRLDATGKTRLCGWQALRTMVEKQRAIAAPSP